MPTATETPVEAYAFCLDARCGGYLQEKVQGVRTTTSWTYLDMGGDMPGEERSTDMIRFADESDAVCGVCEGPRGISEQVRPEYPNVSGHDPMGLFEFRGKTERELQEIRSNRDLDAKDREIEALKRSSELEALRAEMAELKAMLAEKANKPGPKPRGD
jgi:hypothetical protein